MLSCDDEKNCILTEQMASIETFEQSQYKKDIELMQLDLIINLKAQILLNNIEDEIINENLCTMINENKRKKSKITMYFKPLEMKTNCWNNIDEDLFEINGIKESIIKNLDDINENEPITFNLRRKKLRGILLYKTDELIAIKTSENKIYELTYKQINEDKIKIKKEI